MYRLGVVGEPCKAENMLFHGGGGGEDVAVVRGRDELVSETAVASLESGVSSGSLCSSMSSLTDDDAESSLAVVGDRTSSSLSDTMLQLDGDGGGPLYELSPLLAHLPVRTGLSKYYQGKSQSFTPLSDAKCVDDLARKTIPYSSRMKACRGYAASGSDASRSSISRHVPGPYSKTISKKTMPRGSSDRLLSRARSTGLMHSSGKPPAYQSKKELYSTYAS